MEKFTFFWSGPFSQWQPSTLVIDGMTYGCAEQYMMAEKARLFDDPTREELIMMTNSPAQQKALGRQVRGFVKAKWEDVARDVVYRGSYAKYAQNEWLKEKLLETGKRTLVEASPEDRIWGIGLKKTDPRAKKRSTWRGLNWLGEVLSQVRDELAEGQPEHGEGWSWL